MAYILNEQKFIDDNIFQYKNRAETQFTRFIDKKPTFVTYFNINENLSMTDDGFGNVEKILGPNSPIRFNKVENFPVYGLEKIILDLDQDEEGFDSSYDSELIILPDTIEPLPNDFFYINHLGQNILFMVTEVKYDTIKSNNFYKIGYSIKYIDNGEHIERLERQSSDEFNCIFTNIGTNDRCIVQKQDYEVYDITKSIYREMLSKYLSLYFNNRYNSLLYRNLEKGTIIYDKYLTNFVMENNIFYTKNEFETFVLTIEDRVDLFDILYEKTFYRNIEKCDKSKLPDEILYSEAFIYDCLSVFNLMKVHEARTVEFTDCHITGDYIDYLLLRYIKDNNIEDCKDNHIYKLIVKYFNNNADNLRDLDIENFSKDIIEYSFDHFILIPIVLYIIMRALRTFIRK